jgi:nicotinamide mononucleotide (NMN) deamidase PncC
MADKVRGQFGADIGMAIGGHIKRAGGEAREAVYIAVATEANRGTTKTNYPARLPMMTRRIISHALIYLRDFIRS